MRQIRFSVLVLVFALGAVAASTALGATRTSTKDGDWNDPATWGGEDPPVAGDDVVVGHNVTKDSAKANVKSLTVTSDGTLEGKEPGDGIDIEAADDIKNDGTIKTKDATGTTGDNGNSSGSITLKGDNVTNNGTIETGNGSNGAANEGGNGGNSGNIDIESVFGSINNNNTIKTGNGGAGTDADQADETGGDGGKSGCIKTKNSNINNNGEMETGDGGEAGNSTAAAGDAGDGGSSGDIDMGAGTINHNGRAETGKGKDGGDAAGTGKNGGNGGSPGNVKKHGMKGEGKKALTINNNGIDDPGDTEDRPDSPAAGTKGTGDGNSEDSPKDGKIPKPKNEALHMCMATGSRIYGGGAILDIGYDLILSGIDEGTIDVDGDVTISAGRMIDLTGICCLNAIRSTAGEITFFVYSEDDILLDDGVDLADITEPDAVVMLISPIPAVSEWGLIVVTLLGLTVGTVVLGRRRRAAA